LTTLLNATKTRWCTIYLRGRCKRVGRSCGGWCQADIGGWERHRLRAA